MLWDILHNMWTKPIDNPTRELVRLLKEAGLGRWVLSSRVNENGTKTNIAMIVEVAIYRNVNNMYKPMEDLESFENGNVEIGSNGLEEEYADPSNSDKDNSHYNKATNSVINSYNKQMDSRLIE